MLHPDAKKVMQSQEIFFFMPHTVSSENEWLLQSRLENLFQNTLWFRPKQLSSKRKSNIKTKRETSFNSFLNDSPNEVCC